MWGRGKESERTGQNSGTVKEWEVGGKAKLSPDCSFCSAENPPCVYTRSYLACLFSVCIHLGLSLPSQPCPGPPVLFVFSKQPYDCAIDLLPSVHFPALRFTNAPSVFQLVVIDILQDKIGCFGFVYLDDILIYSLSLQEHKEHVWRVLQHLLENCLFLKFHATFWTSWVMSSHWGGRKWYPPRCCVSLASAIKPKTPSKIPRLANFCNFYYYSAVAAPLTALIVTPWPFRGGCVHRGQDLFQPLSSFNLSSPYNS